MDIAALVTPEGLRQPAADLTTDEIAARVLDAARRGRLLLFPAESHTGDGAAHMAGAGSAEDPLIEQVMKGAPAIQFEGARYALISAASWRRLPGRQHVEVVPPTEARATLKRFAARFKDREEALKAVTHRLPPAGPVASSASPVASPAPAASAAAAAAPGASILLIRHRPAASQPSVSTRAPAVTPSQLSRQAPASAPPPASPPPAATGHLIVRVSTPPPMNAPIAGVVVEVPGHGNHTTGTDGRADFGTVPVASYTAQAHKAHYGPPPTGAAAFAVGNASGTQAVAAGATATLELHLVTVTSVHVSHTPVVAATPLRIYKVAVGDAHVDHVITCTALCPRATGSGAGTQYSVRVDWTFTADAANAPLAKGGKDNTSVHFGAAGGHAMGGAGTTTASTTTNDAGETQIKFRASVTSGDKFIVHAKVLIDPANPGAGDLGHHDSPNFEVWKRLDYQNLYRMQTGANVGFDLAARATPANIQPAFTPTFTEYSVGAVHPVAYREYITNLVAPTAAQLPANGKVRVRSDGADTRVVTVHGLIVAADGSTSAGTDVLTLAGTGNVTGARNFQKIAQITVPASPDRTLTVETAAGGAVATVAPRHPSATPNFLFDTAAAVQVKAQAWYDANDAQLGTDMAALNTAIGAAGYFMVGAAYYHPKLDGRATTGRTNYYAGYPTVRITYYSHSFHPDAQWGNVDGVNQGQMSCLFINVGGGSYASMVARHEIGHASDHVTYGTGDHCPQSSCLMYAFSTANQFCTVGTDHSVKRTKGWTP